MATDRPVALADAAIPAYLGRVFWSPARPCREQPAPMRHTPRHIHAERGQGQSPADVRCTGACTLFVAVWLAPLSIPRRHVWRRGRRESHGWYKAELACPPYPLVPGVRVRTRSRLGVRWLDMAGCVQLVGCFLLSTLDSGALEPGHSCHQHAGSCPLCGLRAVMTWLHASVLSRGYPRMCLIRFL